MFILAIGEKSAIILMAHHLFKRSVMYHSKYVLGRTVCLYFCISILFERLCGPRCRLRPVRDCTGDRDEWPVATQTKAGYQGKRVLYLRTGSLKE